MSVHPLIASRFPLLSGISSFKEGFNDPEAAERWIAYAAAPYGSYTLPDLDVENRLIPGPHGSIPIRVYRPYGVADRLPGLLWMHGGAFIGGDLEMPEAHIVSAELAAREAVVVSVDYRLASKALYYPAPLDDVTAAWDWFVSAAGELGTDAARLAIGGASAGANLAVAATQLARDEHRPLPAAMLLAYPVLHFPVPALPDALAVEMHQLPALLRFPAATMVDMIRGYLGRISDLPTYAMPGHGHLENLPPTRILLSEYDDLRSSGELFEQQLCEVGVPVTSTVAAGMLHGHLNCTPVRELPEIERSIDFLARQWPRRAVSSRS
jgi:acetyl esterase